MPSAIVVIEFPSMAAAKAWYSDPAYAPLIKLRQSGSDLDFILVVGGSRRLRTVRVVVKRTRGAHSSWFDATPPWWTRVFFGPRGC
jgi:hypothetical protein